MYSPHQYPWRIRDTEELLHEVTARSGRDFFFTEDVGHHLTRFTRPSRAALTGGLRGVWLGTDRAYALAEAEGASAWDRISADMDANPQLFSSAEDGDCYAWLEQLGCYSPIVHLQQTDGRTSSHLPFTADQNRRGKITGERLLRALKRAYDQPARAGMPAPTDEVYLTLELFSATASIVRDVLEDCAESVAYWRRFVPEDGARLDELVSRLGA
jgi:hypothetical protein